MAVFAHAHAKAIVRPIGLRPHRFLRNPHEMFSRLRGLSRNENVVLIIAYAVRHSTMSPSNAADYAIQVWWVRCRSALTSRARHSLLISHRFLILQMVI